MPKARKRCVAQSFKLDADIVERLDRYSERTGVTKKFVIENAVAEYLKKQERLLGGTARA